MSWQATSAVRRHSRQTNLTLFKLLLYLAEGADKQGIIDPAPNQETIAAEFGCDIRTIRNRFNKLLASGELERTRTGSGPGRPSAYRLCLPLSDMDTKPQPPAAAAGDSLAEQVGMLAAGMLVIRRELRQVMAQSRTESAATTIAPAVETASPPVAGRDSLAERVALLEMGMLGLRQELKQERGESRTESAAMVPVTTKLRAWLRQREAGERDR